MKLPTIVVVDDVAGYLNEVIAIVTKLVNPQHTNPRYDIRSFDNITEAYDCVNSGKHEIKLLIVDINFVIDDVNNSGIPFAINVTKIVNPPPKVIIISIDDLIDGDLALAQSIVGFKVAKDFIKKGNYFDERLEAAIRRLLGMRR